MKELILVVVGAALVNNIILSQFQGLCPFLQSQTPGHFRDCIWGHIRFQAKMYYTLCKEHR